MSLSTYNRMRREAAMKLAESKKAKQGTIADEAAKKIAEEAEQERLAAIEAEAIRRQEVAEEANAKFEEDRTQMPEIDQTSGTELREIEEDLGFDLDESLLERMPEKTKLDPSLGDSTPDTAPKKRPGRKKTE